MYKFFDNLSRFMAYLGGAMLVALVVLTCVSIVGRSLNSVLHSDWLTNFAPAIASRALGLGIGPVNGDYELIEAGVAFAIFAFLPLCQISGAHATVEIFTSAMSPRFNRILQFLIDVIFAFALVLIAIQLLNGLQSKMRSGQTTLLLEFPVWWAYAMSMAGASVAAVISLYIAIMRGVEVYRCGSILPNTRSADH